VDDVRARQLIEQFLAAERAQDQARAERDAQIEAWLRGGDRPIDIARLFDNAAEVLGLSTEQRHGLGLSESAVRIVQSRAGLKPKPRRTPAPASPAGDG
jgi:hypothetical protein